ncbi:unnamed protein product [Rotaria socialis]|uniref:Uncharacterized protein n=1 Tax=Rotaria socialis TaxID=392032 RepID=A0A821E0V1_9BILA|nr:unnamed protein product [Rotaria socialis]CAF3278615.1 unnamed protein product [Rotaria socialis]CAF3408429.1 unnamed protein product [Rotaria socialis]CAF3635074.1 unnamed protein product [Rotaria socialis]CAF4390583.1 unnamed protein product [Rotaria socialis]
MPFSVALVSSDEGSARYIDLFKQLKLISAQENQREYVVHYVMADGAPGITRAQKEIFSQARRLMLGTCRSKMPRYANIQLD